MKKYGFDMTPTFAGGEVYLSSFIDKLMCQAFYNPALLTVLNNLIIGDSNQKFKGSSQFETSNLYSLPVYPNFIVNL